MLNPSDQGDPCFLDPQPHLIIVVRMQKVYICLNLLPRFIIIALKLETDS